MILNPLSVFTDIKMSIKHEYSDLMLLNLLSVQTVSNY